MRRLRGCRNGPALRTAPPLWRRAEVVAATDTKPVTQPLESEQSWTAQEPPPRRRRQADERRHPMGYGEVRGAHAYFRVWHPEISSVVLGSPSQIRAESERIELRLCRLN